MLGICGQGGRGGEHKQSQNIAEVMTELRTRRAKSATCSFRHRPLRVPGIQCSLLTFLTAMSTNDCFLPFGTDSGCASEVQPSDQRPTLDDLSPAQAQRLLEAALQRYHEVDEA